MGYTAEHVRWFVFVHGACQFACTRPFAIYRISFGHSAEIRDVVRSRRRGLWFAFSVRGFASTTEIPTCTAPRDMDHAIAISQTRDQVTLFEPLRVLPT